MQSFLLQFITIFYFMQGIPIIVSRFNHSGQKQVYTVRDSIIDHDNQREYSQAIHDFATMDQCREKQLKEHRVRIRRIQSSGNKRKFPKDFFSRQSTRPHRNTTLKQKNLIDQLAQETACFATIDDKQDLKDEENIRETPKFQEKCSNKNQTTFYKNQTLKHSIKKYGTKKQQQNNLKVLKINEIGKANFENTFSGAQIKEMFNFENNHVDLREIKRPDKQNLPLKKIKLTKQGLLKKFSLIRNKQNLQKSKIVKI